MSSKSLKYNIIINLILSGIEAFILTFAIFIFSFMMLHVFSYRLYVEFADIYNKNQSVQASSLLVCFGLFILFACLIFIKKMNKITEYIGQISKALNLVA